MDKQQLAMLESRLDNWGAWARSGTGTRRTCGSAEGRHVPLKDPDGTRLEEAAKPPIMVADAELVEAAVLRMDRRDRHILVEAHVHQVSGKDLAKALNVAPMLVRPHMISLMIALQGFLDHPLPKRVSKAMSDRGLQSVA